MTTQNSAIEDRLIVALDVDTREEAEQLVLELGGHVSFYKVGWQLFIAAGVNIIQWLTGQGKHVFLDLKLDDTPRTVEEGVRNLASGGVHFFTLQGNGATAAAAKKGRGENEFPKFLQVTALSSWDKSDLEDMGLVNITMDDFVINRAQKIIGSGCEGVIASGTSVGKLREAFANIVIVTPGIRPEGTDANDHKRTLTPYDAIMAGADYLVVGRPIRTAGDKIGMVNRIKSEIQRALSDKDKQATERIANPYSPPLTQALAH